MDQHAEQLIKQVASSPAIVLDKTIDAGRQVAQAVTDQSTIKKAREYWHVLGPGLTTGAADDDPSGIATYSQQGASTGFQLLWLAPLTFPLMATVQEMCARIGLVTGRGLAANIRNHYSRNLLYLCTLLLLGANILNLGADLGAMAKATQLLLPGIDFVYLVTAFTLISLGLQIFTSYKDYSKYLKFLALILVAYIFSTLSIPDLNWQQIGLSAIIPNLSLSKDQIILITGILGTTISPYLFFWQPSQEVEEEILRGKTTIKMRQEETTVREIKNMRLDVWTGMFISNLVMFFIIVACAATLHSVGITNITTAADAAAALRPLAGENAYLLFALGIVGAGLLAVPVLAGSASYAISEAFGWKFGLYRKLGEASAFYGVILIAMLVGFAVNFVGWDPIKILIYSAVGNGIIAPVILFFIVGISSNKKIMGKWVNRPLTKLIGWITTLLMSVTAVAAIYSLATV
jgi:NRAMP (natural resistance-associated macrophage protein)-like metal ion transporter